MFSDEVESGGGHGFGGCEFADDSMCGITRLCFMECEPCGFVRCNNTMMDESKGSSIPLKFQFIYQLSHSIIFLIRDLNLYILLFQNHVRI